MEESRDDPLGQRRVLRGFDGPWDRGLAVPHREAGPGLVNVPVVDRVVRYRKRDGVHEEAKRRWTAGCGLPTLGRVTVWGIRLIQVGMKR